MSVKVLIKSTRWWRPFSYYGWGIPTTTDMSCLVQALGRVTR